MYVLLAVIFLLGLWAFAGFSQKREHTDADLDRIRRHMELREELHRKMLDNLFNGTHDESLFSDMDKLFEDAMKESFGSHFSYSYGSKVKTNWEETSSGRTLSITPETPEQKLDINVQNGMVTIKGKSEVKTAQGISSSDFSSSFSIPQDVDGTKVRMDQKDGKIVIFFPWKTVKEVAPKKDGRVPLPRDDSDVTI